LTSKVLINTAYTHATDRKKLYLLLLGAAMVSDTSALSTASWYVLASTWLVEKKHLTHGVVAVAAHLSIVYQAAKVVTQLLMPRSPTYARRDVSLSISVRNSCNLSNNQGTPRRNHNNSPYVSVNPLAIAM
jgi:hypothetical protein